MVWRSSGRRRAPPRAVWRALLVGLVLGCNSSGTLIDGPADAAHDSARDSAVVDGTVGLPDGADAATDSTMDQPDSSLDSSSDAGEDAPGDATDGQTDGDVADGAAADTSPSVQDSGIDAGDTATTPQDSGVFDGSDATLGSDGSDGGVVDATVHDSAPDAQPDTGPDAADAASDAGTITCTTTRQVPASGGCTASVTVEQNVGLFPVNYGGEWAGALGTTSAGITDLYSASPNQQILTATDSSLALYVGYTMMPGDGGPDDWGTALRTDNAITSFTLNATRIGTLPPNCNVPQISVQCSGATTIGCQWYGLPCASGVACCPDSIFTPVGDAGPWPVACSANVCCNPTGARCNSDVGCCSGACGGDAGARSCL
jgi:hypothetical protein